MSAELNQPVTLTQGERLRLFRTRAGLSRPELARRVEISTRQLARYENDAPIPSDVLKAICVELDISADFIVGLRDIPSRVSLNSQSPALTLIRHPKPESIPKPTHIQSPTLVPVR